MLASMFGLFFAERRTNERRGGLPWLLLFWLEKESDAWVRVFSMGRGRSAVLLKRRRKERCSSREASLQSTVGSSKKRIKPPPSFLRVRSGPNEGKGGQRGRKRDRGPSVLLPAAVGKKKSQREGPPVGWKMEKKVGLLSRLLPQFSAEREG